MALVEGCKHAFDITVPVEEVETATNQVVSEFQQQAQLPGFRRGKAPATIVRRKFSSAIRQEVLEKLIPRYLGEQIRKEDLRVVGEPQITKVDFELGEPLHFEVELEVAPSFELGDYHDLTVTYSTPEVTDDEVNQRIESVRQEKGEYVNIDPRPLEDGDFAVVSLESVSGLEDDPVKQSEVVIEIGNPDTLAGFTENLRGASPGEAKEFDVTYPEEYSGRFAGKTIRFKAEVTGIRKKELPELNDDFAKDLGDFENLEELRDSVRKSIYREKEAAATRAAKEELIGKLVETHDFPLPESYVNRQVRFQVERQFRTLAGQGVDVNQLDIDWDNFRERHRERAVHDVRASLILDKIAEREGVHATNDEVDAEVNRLAARRQMAVAALRPQLEKDGTLDNLAAGIREEKTLSLLFDKARKVLKQEEA